MSIGYLGLILLVFLKQMRLGLGLLKINAVTFSRSLCLNRINLDKVIDLLKEFFVGPTHKALACTFRFSFNLSAKQYHNLLIVVQNNLISTRSKKQDAGRPIGNMDRPKLSLPLKWF